MLAILALGFAGFCVAALHILQVDRDRAYVRGHDAGRAEVAEAVAREAEAKRTASDAILSSSQVQARELERQRDGLESQLDKLERGGSSASGVDRGCLDAGSVQQLNALGRDSTGSGP